MLIIYTTQHLPQILPVETAGEEPSPALSQILSLVRQGMTTHNNKQHSTLDGSVEPWPEFKAKGLQLHNSFLITV